MRPPSFRLTGTAAASGIGTHSGAPASLTIAPAPDVGGIAFQRTDIDAAPALAADWRSVSATMLATVLGDPANGGVATVEHVMAALAGLGVHDALIRIDGAEVPIMDGSAAPFVAAINAAGLVPRSGAVEVLRILKPVRAAHGDAWAELVPDDAPRFEVTIEFPEPVIGRQSIAFDLTPETFRAEIAPARTFGRVAEVAGLRAMGYAKGSSLDNAVAVAEDGRQILNPEGLRFPDEFVRHKALDAIGDLALAGRPILGRYRSHKGGHRLNQQMLAALFASPDAFETVTVA